MKIADWETYIDKRGTSGDMVYDLLHDWQKSEADHEQEKKAILDNTDKLFAELKIAIEKVVEQQEQIAELKLENVILREWKYEAVQRFNEGAKAFDILNEQITALKEELRLSGLRGDSLDRVVGECVEKELVMEAESEKYRKSSRAWQSNCEERDRQIVTHERATKELREKSQYDHVQFNREFAHMVDKKDEQIAMLKADHEQAMKEKDEHIKQLAKVRDARDKQIAVLKSSRCNNDIGDGTVCNAELVDGGEGVGIFCPLCDLRDTMHEQREQIAMLKAERDSLKMYHDSTHGYESAREQTIENLTGDNTRQAEKIERYKEFWEWSREADKQLFLQDWTIKACLKQEEEGK